MRGLPWTFTPDQHSVDVRIGATGMAYFKVVNDSDQPLTGRAVYNVVPEQAGAYFQKLQCFCFSAQTLQPHQTAEFPVVFFVAPGFATDRDTSNFTDITLSYTFFPAKPDKAGAAPVKTTAAKPVSALGAAGGPGL